VETRSIRVSSQLNENLTFPHVHAVFQIKREISDLEGKSPRVEYAYGLTSLSGTDAKSATRLLDLVRGHWRIENGLHWVRDVTYDEDRSQIRTDNGPRIMASLRNLAISMLRLAGAKNIAKATRWCARNRDACQRLIGLR